MNDNPIEVGAPQNTISFSREYLVARMNEHRRLAAEHREAAAMQDGAAGVCQTMLDNLLAQEQLMTAAPAPAEPQRDHPE